MDDQRRTTDLHPPTAEVRLEPTASGLVYLFAHELVPPVTGRTTRSAVKVPCRQGIMVPQQPLATVLLATAFWSLREQGYIILEIDKQMWVRVRVTGREQVQHQALEGQIMANLPTKGGVDVASIIYSCWKDNTINPWNDVVTAAAQAVRGISQECGKLATLAGAFADVAQRWQRFQTSEPVLYTALLDECVRGIVARTESEHVGKGKSSNRGGGVDMGEILVAGAALGTGLALANSDGNANVNIGADSGADSRGFFDFLGDFFGGLGDFLGDLSAGLGDFLGGDSDGGFDFD